jgi:hypothetical protein
MTYYDRFRFAIEDAHGNIVARDVVGQEAKIARMLSGPAQINFKLHPKEPSIIGDDGAPIQLRPYSHMIHALKDGIDGNEIIWASAIMQPSEVDPQTGIMDLRAEGFSKYLNGIPWMENWNPFAVDPFHVIERVWKHVQSYDNAKLNVSVYPTESGMQMLPGFYFNNEEFVQDFFAIFIRESDLQDCGDYVNKLSRDIPIDYIEEASWNEDRSKINKFIHLGYPSLGVLQDDLVFRMNENIQACTPKQTQEIDWFSDIIIKGYFPGKEYSSVLSNADPDRYRRVMKEEDLHIDSNERCAAWAHRKLTRRQTPPYFESVLIDPYHPNAPFSTYEVGDTIRIQGPMPWTPTGYIDQEHRIMQIAWDEAKATMQLSLMAKGAFNYDPIHYVAPPPA